jgi:two-component system, OmpR family, response regulator
VSSETTPTILMIDDSESVLEESRLALSQAGFRVIATTQTVGIGRHLRNCGLVIIDYHMPGLDGRAVLESLKAAAEATGAAPTFYMYTSDDTAAQHARELGFDGVFGQKGSVSALVRQVETMFRLQRLRGISGSKSYPPKA